MSMYFAEGREADAEREAEEAREAEKRKKPIDVWCSEEFPDEPHWAIMIFDRSKQKHILPTYTAYLDRSIFEDAARTLKSSGQRFRAFHVDSIAKITVEVSIK